jgi:hypothetical protein
MSFCADSGLLVTIISEAAMYCYFISLKRIPFSEGMRISVSGTGHISRKHAEIKVCIKGETGRYIWITAIAHIVKVLLCNLLIVNNTIHPYLGILNLSTERLLLGKA